MKTSQGGLDLIKEFEGFRADAYRCPAGVLTVGFGRTSAAGSPVRAGMRVTKAEAEAMLREDLGQYERAVSKALTRQPTQPQFDAMVSLCYNIGAGGFAKSSVVRRFNAGQIENAADAFRMWNKSNGKVLNGLVRRREAERELFLSTGSVGAKIAHTAPDRALDGWNIPAAPVTAPAPVPAPRGFWARLWAWLAG